MKRATSSYVTVRTGTFDFRNKASAIPGIRRTQLGGATGTVSIDAALVHKSAGCGMGKSLV